VGGRLEAVGGLSSAAESFVNSSMESFGLDCLTHPIFSENSASGVGSPSPLVDFNFCISKLMASFCSCSIFLSSSALMPFVKTVRIVITTIRTVRAKEKMNKIAFSPVLSLHSEQNPLESWP
jgi:hypothetical protein